MTDPISLRLQALQLPITAHLWVPADAITFTPHVLSKVYGDGRALFYVGTINSRPAYWIIRGCSTWMVHSDYDAPDGSVDVADMIDDIMNDLEEEFGRAESDVDYEWDDEDRIVDLNADVDGPRFMSVADISYPTVDYGGGAHWGRADWPNEIDQPLVDHPFTRRYRILEVSGK